MSLDGCWHILSDQFRIADMTMVIDFVGTTCSSLETDQQWMMPQLERTMLQDAVEDRNENYRIKGRKGGYRVAPLN